MKKILKIEEIEHEDYVQYVDTDSNFFSATPLIKCYNIGSGEVMSYCIKLTNDMASNINKLFNYMVLNVFNVPSEKNKIKIMPDIIASNALWMAKKRYVLLITYNLDNNQEVKDKYGNLGKLKVKGIDTVRSSFAPAFRQIVSKLLEDLLRGKDTSKIDQEVMEFEENIDARAAAELCKTSSVKFISLKGDKNYNDKDRQPFEIVKGAPITAKAGNNHNDLIKLWKLQRQYELIRHGDKCKWVYLLPNSYAIDVIAYRGDDTDSDRLLNFIEEYVDKHRIYTQELKTKLVEIYSAIGRPFPNRGSEKAIKVFNFEETW